MTHSVSPLKNACVLIVDDDKDILMAGRLLLKRHFKQVLTTHQPEQLPQLLAQNPVDVILLDMNFCPGESQGEQGVIWLKQIMALDSEAVVIMITAHGSVNIAVEAMKLGATDFVTKPWQNEKLVATVTLALKLKQSKQEASQLRHTNQVLNQANMVDAVDNFWGNSVSIQKLLQAALHLSRSDKHIIILGEKGGDKALLAKQIHQQSKRAEQAFISLDFAAINESLHALKLFGEQQGAVKEAAKSQAGYLSASHGGTLYFCGLSYLSETLKARLIEHASHNKALDLRFIFDFGQQTEQSNQALATFKQALYCSELTLAPLRQRKDDIVPLSIYYLKQFCHKYQKPVKQLSNDAKQALYNNAWLGNVSALRHAIERVVILYDDVALDAHHFSLSAVTNEGLALPPEFLNPIEHNGHRVQATEQEPQKLEQEQVLNLDQVEQVTIKRALVKHQFNISHAAKELGLTRASLYRRMDKYDL